MSSLARRTFFAVLVGAAALITLAADRVPGPSAVQLQRAEKIAVSLNLADAEKSHRVRDLIAQQYANLSVIHATRDTALRDAKTLAEKDRSAAEAAIQAARGEAEAAQDRLHAPFLAALAVELTPAQIDTIKDGMTYGVLPLTYRVYQEMLPQLTAPQKAQLLAWLTEAREHAMDASTAEEKHAWFGKYKGRINNYLARAGYDMKAAEKNLALHR